MLILTARLHDLRCIVYVSVEPMDSEFADGIIIHLNPAGTGSCQFIAVSDQLLSFLGRQYSPANLRKQSAQFLRSSESNVIVDNFLCEDKEQYLSNLEKPTTHGDHVTLLTMATFLSVEFLVLSKKGSNVMSAHLISPLEEVQGNICKNSSTVLFLGHYDESEKEHYVSLVPCQKLNDLYLHLKRVGKTTLLLSEGEHTLLATLSTDPPTIECTVASESMQPPNTSSPAYMTNPTDDTLSTSEETLSTAETVAYFADATGTGSDIGFLIANGINMQNLPSDKMLQILQYEHPTEETLYPTTMMNGCFRRFKPSWLLEHPWLQYSWKCDGVFCKSCCLFGPKDVSYNKLGVFVTKPFAKWTKKSEAFKNHATVQYHLDSIAKMNAFKTMSLNPAKAIDKRLDQERAELTARNRSMLVSLFRVVLLCGRQGLALCGHRDDSVQWQSNAEDTGNLGNFIELVKFRAETDTVLADHLAFAPDNAKYTSKTIQNELTDVIADEIRQQLLKDIREATYYSVMADEVTDVSNHEQLSIVIRYVTRTLEVKEVFIDIIQTERITGKVLAQLIIDRLFQWELPLVNLRGQAYDGAANMAGLKSGCQAVIREKAPLAFYTHCASYRLNLAVVSLCSIVAVRDSLNTISELSRFFAFSPKRQAMFESVIEKSNTVISAQKLKDVCRTRWIERIEAYETFFSLFPSLIMVLQAMVCSSAHGQFGEWNWDSETTSRAQGFLHSITSSSFLVASSIVMDILSQLRVVTVKLQGRCTDIMNAYSLVSDVTLQFCLLRSNIEEEFALMFRDIEQRADDVGVEISVPRIVGRQIHRSRLMHKHTLPRNIIAATS